VRTEVFPFEIRGAIFIDDKGEMRLVSFMGISETDVEPCNKIDRGQCLCGRAMATGKVVISQDSSEETGHEQCTHAGNAHGNIIIPLIAVGKTVGILSLYTKPGTEVTENLVKLFSILGGQIGIAINNAMFYEEIKNLSLHDPLTGLANRRFMEIQLEKDFEAARRYGGKLSVVMIDIDHFKQYNDTHGHQEGDRLLAKLAAVLLKMLRAMDTVFRYGGEEFLALLPGTDLAQAVATAERIRAAVEAQAGVTISLGVSEYGKTITDKGTLIKRADKALYRAKMGGRNRTESAEDEETSG
jgi:diguanylate cyclase (GGDEF)-like protein